MVKVNFIKLNENAVKPTYGSQFAAGADLYACEGGEVTYQWYSCKDENGLGAVKLADATDTILPLADELKAGEYYYFVKIMVNGIPAKESAVACVTVEA